MEDSMKDYLADLIILIRDKYKESLVEASGESESETDFPVGIKHGLLRCLGYN